MKSEIPSFLDFEVRMEPLRSRNPHLWSIRDLLYRILTKSGKKQNTWKIGYLIIFYQLLRSACRNSKFTFTSPKPLTSRAFHFIFLNAAPNHFGKLYPLFAKYHSKGEVIGWVEDAMVRSKVRGEHINVLRTISNFNVCCMKFSDLAKAWNECKQIKEIFAEFSETRFMPGLFFSLLQYYSMLRFWSVVFTKSPYAVFTTFEKSITAKSMMEASYLAECPQRVHWLHGLGHPSHAPTFATEMWCMRNGEVELLNMCLPKSCVAKCVISDESMRLREVVGVLDQSLRNEVSKLHILVLGTSTDPTYALDMRMEDLSTIKAIMKSNPSLFEWRFRPHPGAIDPYRNELRLSDIPAPDFSLRSLDDDLRWSHVIITPFSSVGVDAHDLGRIVFWNQAGHRDIFNINQLIYDGIGTRIDVSKFTITLMKYFPKHYNN